MHEIKISYSYCYCFLTLCSFRYYTLFYPWIMSVKKYTSTMGKNLFMYNKAFVCIDEDTSFLSNNGWFSMNKNLNHRLMEQHPLSQLCCLLETTMSNK